MAEEAVSTSDTVDRRQAAFWKLLEYVGTYNLPTETGQQQEAFFRSFLTRYPLPQTKKSRAGGYIRGNLHTPRTFKVVLRDAIRQHGHGEPRSLVQAMEMFFDSKGTLFKRVYLEKCQAASQRFHGSSTREENGNEYVATSDRRTWTRHENQLSGRTASPSRAETRWHPMWRELQGCNGPRIAKRKRSSMTTDESKNGTDGSDQIAVEQVVSSAHPHTCHSRQMVPVVPRLEGREVAAHSSVKMDDKHAAVKQEVGCSGRSRSMQTYQSVGPDRRMIAERMNRAESLYASFRRHLGDGRDDQANFDAMPPSPLRQLYEKAFGIGWRVTLAQLVDQELAENADVLYCLTGAALDLAIFNPPAESMLPLLPKSSPLHGQEQGKATLLARRLSELFNAHMRHQPPRASRPDGFVSTELETELVRVFAEAFALKNYVLATDANLEFRWRFPRDDFTFDTMRTGIYHAAPPSDDAGVCKVAMCFLPSIEKVDKTGRRTLYKAVVKVADGI